MSEIENLVPKIKLLGLGGAGCNAVDFMIESNVRGVEFIAANTDAQALSLSKAPRKIQLGKKTTRGLGSGAKPEIGCAAAEESLGEISDAVMDADILFLAGGMGGGTGSGAMPVAAALAREKGILTVAVITTPFEFEGDKKSLIADGAVEKLSTLCDCLIVLPNQNLFKAGGEGITFKNACRLSDSVLLETVRNISDLIMKPGLINLDFADIKSIMASRGRSIIGSASERGEGRAERAVARALDNPMFAGENIYGASGLLVNITGNSENLTLDEVQKIMNEIRRSLDTLAVDFMFGTCFDDSMGEALKVSVIATGIDGQVRRKAFDFSDGSIASSPAGIGRVKTLAREDKKDAEPSAPAASPFARAAASSVDFDSALSGVSQKIKDDEIAAVGLSKKYDDVLSSAAEQSEIKGAPAADAASAAASGAGAAKGKKNLMLDFFNMIGAEKDEKSFIPDVKLSVNPEAKEEDNVVFLAGSMTEAEKKERQTDLMEFIQSSEGGLGIPSILKKPAE